MPIQKKNTLRFQEKRPKRNQLFSNLENKRINVEKEKIFELKLSIQSKTLMGEQLLVASTNQLDTHLGGNITLADNKELIMTKL